VEIGLLCSSATSPSTAGELQATPAFVHQSPGLPGAASGRNLVSKTSNAECSLGAPLVPPSPLFCLQVPRPRPVPWLSFPQRGPEHSWFNHHAFTCNLHSPHAHAALAAKYLSTNDWVKDTRECKRQFSSTPTCTCPNGTVCVCLEAVPPKTTQFCIAGWAGTHAASLSADAHFPSNT
jgi:hypothetical protein